MSRKTGQPPWFAKMKWDREREKKLRQLPLDMLVQHKVCSGKQASRMESAGIKTIWDFVSADVDTLLNIEGFGVKTVQKLSQDYKIKVHDSVNWSVPDGR